MSDLFLVTDQLKRMLSYTSLITELIRVKMVQKFSSFAAEICVRFTHNSTIISIYRNVLNVLNNK